MTFDDLIRVVSLEMAHAYAKYGNYNNSHECYGVLCEELAEWFDTVRGNYADEAAYELVQLASVALRYVMERGDIDMVRKAQNTRWAK
jgi:hypothetical protein